VKAILKIAYGIVCGLLSAGLIYLISSQPRGEPIKLNPPPTSAPLVVYVTGAVNHPGVYKLSQDSRVQDAIIEAGGLSVDADPQNLNLAAFLKDGSRVLVPTLYSVIPTQDIPETASLGKRSSDIDYMININTATQEELESLPYIGTEYAQRIIAYREAYGTFATIEAIQEVYGIGPKTFENIKDLITIK